MTTEPHVLEKSIYPIAVSHSRDGITYTLATPKELFYVRGRSLSEADRALLNIVSPPMHFGDGIDPYAYMNRPRVYPQKHWYIGLDGGERYLDCETWGFASSPAPAAGEGDGP